MDGLQLFDYSRSTTYLGDKVTIAGALDDYTKKVVAINHDVADYDQWKAVFNEVPPSTMGARFHRINRSVDDPTTSLWLQDSTRSKPRKPARRTTI